MASKKIEFHEEAALEYEAALEWYLERSHLAASKFVDALKFLLQRFPFAIVYRELPAAIQVLAIAHARRKPGYWKQRR